MIFIDGLGLKGYRSFGVRHPKFGPFKKINLFIGQNNSGKSNILRFLVNNLKAAWEDGRKAGLTDLDYHKGLEDGPITMSLGVTLVGSIYESILKKHEQQRTKLEAILRSQVLTNGTNLSWFHYQIPSERNIGPDRETWVQLRKELGENKNWWQNLWSALTKLQDGGLVEHWIPETVGSLSPEFSKVPKINMIQAIREVAPSLSEQEDGLSGKGLIERLAQIQNPTHGNEVMAERFDAVNTFLKSVIGNETARIEIPYDRKTILVHLDGKRLPLDSLGTGIHELIILASAATVIDKEILCIEEPEIHLHPLLQRKLLNYLARKTNNQYFIATHSAHILDSPDTAVFHVTLEGGESIVTSAPTSNEKSLICLDLGYKASDILQANCIIWVEGPTDRLYLNHWLLSIDGSLIEGLDYSIMFYGGRLLNHLTADDHEVSDFIVGGLGTASFASYSRSYGPRGNAYSSINPAQPQHPLKKIPLTINILILAFRQLISPCFACEFKRLDSCAKLCIMRFYPCFARRLRAARVQNPTQTTHNSILPLFRNAISTRSSRTQDGPLMIYTVAPSTLR